MPPKAKRAKLDGLSLLGLRKVSYHAVRAVLYALPEELRSIYDPKHALRDIDRAVEDLLDGDLTTTIDLPLADGSVHKWLIARPQGLLRKFTANSAALQRALRRVPNSCGRPWNIVHYHDEVTAGHLLSPVHSRSYTAFRYSFKEFGRHLISCNEMWFEYAILRTPVLEQVVCGTSYVARRLMHLFFTSAEGLKI